MADDPRAPAAVLCDDGCRRALGPRRDGYADPVAQMVARARRHGVYLNECPDLAGLLMQMDLDARIPPALYEVIAELLVWIEETDAGAAHPFAPQPR